MYGLNEDDVIIMFVSKLRDIYYILDDIRSNQLTQSKFVDLIQKEFGLKKTICDSIYYRLTTLSKIK